MQMSRMIPAETGTDRNGTTTRLDEPYGAAIYLATRSDPVGRGPTFGLFIGIGDDFLRYLAYLGACPGKKKSFTRVRDT